MKKLLLRILYFAAIPLFCMIGINYFVDPAYIFNEIYYETIIHHFKNNENVSTNPNFDDRLLHKLYIESFDKCPDEIVLGSSRVKFVGKAADIRKTGCINNGVNGASLEDILSIYYIYEKTGCKIKKISLGLDPYYLNENHGQNRWKTLEAEFIDFQNKLFSEEKQVANFGFYNKYTELFSSSYFNASLKFLITGKDKNVYPTQEVNNENMTLLVDGTTTYDKEKRNISSEDVERNVKKIIASHSVYSMQDFHDLSAYYKSLFLSFVDYAINKNIELEFVFVPIHPLLFDYLQNSPNYEIFFEAERFYRDIATEKQINIIGSFNPNDFNLDNSDFYDDIHCKEGAIRKLYQEFMD